MDVFDKYLTVNRMWSFEGDSGVRKFERLVADLGYNDLHDFLADNPGAMAAMLDFVTEWVGRNDEWHERIASLVEEV